MRISFNSLITRITAVTFMLFLFNLNGFGQVPAFPTAEGFGSTTIGGRGGKVIEVTNLNDSGPGSFRAACETSGPRIVVFKVGGIIVLNSLLKIYNPYLTIAGQTAPGDGICIRHNAMWIVTHDVIIRGLRWRTGSDFPDGLQEFDCFVVYRENSNVAAPYNVIFDHCSASWVADEVFSTWNDGGLEDQVRDITIQWCIVSEGIAIPHDVYSNGMSLLIGNDTKNVSAHHNLFAHMNARTPNIHDNSSAEFIDNVIYNYGEYATHAGNCQMSIINNQYIPGVSTTETAIEWEIIANGEAYLSGNIGPNGKTDWDMSPSNSSKVLSPPVYSGITIQPVVDAYNLVLTNAGALSPTRDLVDIRIINETQTRTGHIFRVSEEEVGGYPIYNSGTPLTDSDSDGMPDLWENDNGLNPDVYDANGHDLDVNYDNIEVYINSLIPSPYVQFSLTTSTDGNGTILPNGGIFYDKQKLTITATGNLGYAFDYWGGDLSGTNNPTDIIMDTNKTVSAVFKVVPTHNLVVNSSGNGSVLLSPKGGEYSEGVEVTLTAVPDAGYKFDSWGGDLSGSVNPKTVVIDSEKTISATFVKQQSLVAQWEMNETSGTVAHDNGENGYDLTLVKTDNSNWNNDALRGMNLVLDGHSEYGKLSMDDSKGFHLPVFSITAFIKMEKGSITKWNRMLGMSDAFGFNVNEKGNLGMYYPSSAEWTGSYANNPSLADGEWHHVAVTHNNLTGGLFYIDGELVLTQDFTPEEGGNEIKYPGGEPLRLGFSGGSNYFPGHFQDVRIYRDFLSQDKIKKIMNETASITDITLNNKQLSVYPNPFSSTVAINYSIVKKSEIEILIYDMQGILIEELEKETKQVGNYNIVWDGSDMPTGIYLCVFKNAYRTVIKRLVKIK